MEISRLFYLKYMYQNNFQNPYKCKFIGFDFFNYSLSYNKYKFYHDFVLLLQKICFSVVPDCLFCAFSKNMKKLFDRSTYNSTS